MKKLIGLGMSAVMLTGVLFFAGCESGGGGGDGSKKSDVNVAGVWQGVLTTSANPPVQSTFRFDLRQATNSLAITGSVRTTVPDIFNSAQLTGEVDGRMRRMVNFTGTSRDGKSQGSFGAAFKGTADGDTLEMSAVLVQITGVGTNASSSGGEEYFGILTRASVSGN